VILDANNEFMDKTISKSKLSNVAIDPNSDSEKEYNKAYKDSGMESFEADDKNLYKSEQERIHGIGAHEEEHLKPENVKAKGVYNKEKPAFEAELKQRI
jgi:hypothetical protein